MEELFYEIFEGIPRLGPGSDEATLRALDSTGLRGKEVKVLDIGCGTGAQTFVLARELKGKLIALDNYQAYLDHIEKIAAQSDFPMAIRTLCMDMKSIVCRHESLDLVWAEGSVYIMGFEKALQTIYPLLKKGGYAVFSDMNYLKPDPPEAVKMFMDQECPEILAVKENLALIQRSSFSLVDHFILDRSAHWDPYFMPLQKRVHEFRLKYHDHSEARAISDSINQEISLYQEFGDYYGYVFYIMQKK